MDIRTCFRLLTLFLLFTSTGCTKPLDTLTPTLAPATQTPPLPTATAIPIAAKVNGEDISLEEFNTELLRFKDAQNSLGKAVSDEEANERVLNNLIDQLLLIQGAHTAGYVLKDSELDERLATLEEDVGGAEVLSARLTSHGYTREAYRQSLKNAVEAAWMRDKILADLPTSAEQVHVQQILLYNLETAQDVQSKLLAGADFGSLASAYDPQTKGELFWFPRGYLWESNIEKAAFSLEVGKPSEIIETEVGFHIIVVLEHEANHPLSPDALLTLQENALNEWLQKARETSRIEK